MNCSGVPTGASSPPLTGFAANGQGISIEDSLRRRHFFEPSRSLAGRLLFLMPGPTLEKSLFKLFFYFLRIKTVFLGLGPCVPSTGMKVNQVMLQ